MFSSVLIVAAGLLIAVDVPKDQTKDGLDKLQGTWTGVSMESEGVAADEAQAHGMKLVIKGNKYTFTTGGGQEEEGTLKVDASKKPKTMDVHITAGAEKGQTQLGIYEIDGDTFRLCVAGDMKDRPTELKSKADSGHGLFVFKRAKQ